MTGVCRAYGIRYCFTFPFHDITLYNELYKELHVQCTTRHSCFVRACRQIGSVFLAKFVFVDGICTFKATATFIVWSNKWFWRWVCGLAMVALRIGSGAPIKPHTKPIFAIHLTPFHCRPLQLQGP